MQALCTMCYRGVTVDRTYSTMITKVQDYVEEESQLLEDLRHGLILGSQNFVAKIRKTYLPGEPHAEVPQQRKIMKDKDPIKALKKSAVELGCDLDQYKRAPRISQADRDDRNLLVLSAWQTGVLNNKEIGDLLGITYSSVSHIVRTVRKRLPKTAI